jgi:hypothetical protein
MARLPTRRLREALEEATRRAVEDMQETAMTRDLPTPIEVRRRQDGSHRLVFSSQMDAENWAQQNMHDVARVEPQGRNSVVILRRGNDLDMPENRQAQAFVRRDDGDGFESGFLDMEPQWGRAPGERMNALGPIAAIGAGGAGAYAQNRNNRRRRT